MVLVVIDPNLVPLAAVQLAPRFDVHLARRAGAQREIERQLVVTGQRNHERWVVRPNGRLKQQNRLFAGGAKRERNVALAPTGHLDVRLRRGEGDDVFLRIWNTAEIYRQ